MSSSSGWGRSTLATADAKALLSSCNLLPKMNKQN